MKEQADPRWSFALVFFTVALLSPHLPPVAAQAPAANPKLTSTPPLTYDIVSIKPNRSGSGAMSVRFSPTTYSATNTTLPLLIQDAYGLRMDGLISGLPPWAGSTHFDIQAKTDDTTAALLDKLPHEQRIQRQETMFRAILEDRFHLQVHSETKDLPIYALVVAKGGFKLAAADPNNTYENGIKGPDGKSSAGMMMVGRGEITAQATPITNLAQNLTYQVHRIVIDQTGLTGKYDITLKWSPDDASGNPSDSSAPSIFTALQEQLGLKLQAQKAPVETIVVDHVELPTEN
jgi:uncharacterized protein (TIGR03435 family)